METMKYAIDVDESEAASRWMGGGGVLQRRVLGLTIEAGGARTTQHKDLKPRWLLKLSLDILMKGWKALSLYSKETSSEIKMRSVEIFHLYLPVRLNLTTRGGLIVCYVVCTTAKAYRVWLYQLRALWI